jgi:lipopolysaccharide export system permease protein
MNKILFKYLIQNFLKTFLIMVTIFYCFGILLNLFEEIEFFKNIEANVFTPLVLTSLIIPSLIIKILPFIIFISSMWFMLKLRNNTELTSLKVYGYSNLKIFFILAITSFIIGWLILFILNPITSAMAKFYEKTKSNYSRDIDHLVLFNKNGLWIKEQLENQQRIISAENLEKNIISNLNIYHLNENSNLTEKIFSKKADITDNEWKLYDVTIFKTKNNVSKQIKKDFYTIESKYDYDQISNLYKNFDSLSFVDILINYESHVASGYNNEFLNQSLHSMLTLPFFLLLMTALAAVLTMNTLRKSDNIKFIIVGLISSIGIFYLKNLSLALGQTDKIPLILAIWAPIIILSFLIFIGILQVNEK